MCSHWIEWCPAGFIWTKGHLLQLSVNNHFLYNEFVSPIEYMVLHYYTVYYIVINDVDAQ